MSTEKEKDIEPKRNSLGASEKSRLRSGSTKQTDLDSFRKKADKQDIPINIQREFVKIGSKMDALSKALENLVSKEDMDKKLQVLKQAIIESNEEIIDKLEQRVSDLEDENAVLRNTVTTLETEIREQETIIKKQRSEFECQLNDLEQQGRKNSVRVYGLTDNEKETCEECIEKVAKLISEKLETPCHPADIDIAHRMGEYRKDKPRSVICKFVRRMKKHEVIKNRRKLKGTKIVIAEDMTKYNRDMLQKFQEVRGVDKSWFSDGKMYVKLSNGMIKRVSRQTPLNQLTDMSKR